MSLLARLGWWLVLGALAGSAALVAGPANGQSFPPDGIYEVTAYACPPYCGLTASGAQVGPGSVASPDWIPFGTSLIVDGWYSGIVTDRGGEIYGRRLDLWLPSHDAAIQWGRRWVTVRWHPASIAGDDASDAADEPAPDELAPVEAVEGMLPPLEPAT